jgi:hypothetical protein
MAEVGNAIVVGGNRYPGITKVLRETFYSNYKPPVRYRRKGRSVGSRERGDAVHRQIYHAFHCLRVAKGACDCRQRYGKRTPDRSRTSLQVALLREFLRKHQLEFWRGEVAVAWPELGLGTYVDGVARHRLTGRLYALEFKTGYPRESRRRASSMLAIQDDCRMDHARHLSNCPYNQHQLQLWFGMEALRRTVGKEHEVEDGALLYFDREGVDVEWHNHWRTHDAQGDTDFERFLNK